MTSIPKNNIHKLENIVTVFKDHNIQLHPAGLWKWDEDRNKIQVDANRTDGLDLDKYPNDNMLKHRAELSGVCVIDCDGIPLDKVDDWFPTTKKSFYTTTSKREKQHRYIYPPNGKQFPETRAIKDLHKDLDIITNGIVFEAHDYKSKDSQFSMNNGEILRCSEKEYDLICSILKPKEKKPKQNKFANNKNDIIKKFNEKFSCEELLMAQGYLKIRDRLIHPESKSKVAGIIFFDDGCVYSHSSDWLNDGSSHDAFDIYAHYEHDDDKGTAMSCARDLMDLNYHGFEKADVDVDYKRLMYIKSQIGFNEKTTKFYMLNKEGKLVTCGRKDIWDYIDRTFPPFYNIKHIDVSEEEKEFKDRIKSIKYKAISDIMYNNSFSKLDRKIDPFAKENMVKLIGDNLSITTYDLFPNLDVGDIKYDYAFSKKVYADFGKHFPELPQIIDVIVASRFGGDRKKCFIYTQMVSDFGKSFLGAVFKKLGLLAGIKESELKKASSGDAVGLDPLEFTTAWILFFDEFKSAIGEIKEITHNMTLSPKHQLKTEVQLYTKWFASKETSESLVGNGGVDSQFANRFAMIDTGFKRLTDRELFKDDNNAYLKALTYYLYGMIKAKSDKYIAMGEKKAGIEANKVIDAFRKKYELKATLDENTDELIEEIFDFLESVLIDLDIPIVERVELTALAREIFIKHKDVIYLRQAKRCNLFFDEYAKNYFGKDNFRKISHQKHLFRERFADKKHRTSIMISDEKVDVYHRMTKDGKRFDPIIDG